MKFVRDEEMTEAEGKPIIMIPWQNTDGTYEKRYYDLGSMARCATCGELHTYEEFEKADGCPVLQQNKLNGGNNP